MRDLFGEQEAYQPRYDLRHMSLVNNSLLSGIFAADVAKSDTGWQSGPRPCNLLGRQCHHRELKKRCMTKGREGALSGASVAVCAISFARAFGGGGVRLLQSIMKFLSDTRVCGNHQFFLLGVSSFRGFD